MLAALSIALAVAVAVALAGLVRVFQASAALTEERRARHDDVRRLADLEKDLRNKLEVESAARLAKVDAEIARRRKDFYIEAGNGAIIKWLKVHHPAIVDDAMLQVRDPEIRQALADYWGERAGGYQGTEPAPTKMKVPLKR